MVTAITHAYALAPPTAPQVGVAKASVLLGVACIGGCVGIVCALREWRLRSQVRAAAAVYVVHQPAHAFVALHIGTCGCSAKWDVQNDHHLQCTGPSMLPTSDCLFPGASTSSTAHGRHLHHLEPCVSMCHACIHHHATLLLTPLVTPCSTIPSTIS